MFWRSASLIAVSCVLGVLATVAVVLRFVARRLKGLRIWADDYLIIAALVLAWGVCCCNVVGASIGRFGDHEIFETEGPRTGRPLARLMVIYGQVCFACRLLHATAMQLLKISLLLFFRRIFDQNRRFLVVFWIMTGYVALWWMVCFWLNVFTCYPIPWTWSPSLEMAQHCLPNYHLFFSLAALTNVVSDVAIIIIPFPFLFSLRMSVEKKLAIGGLILTGAVVIVAGIGRTIAFFTVGHTFDYTYENYYYLIWSSVEPCVGVIGCCLPTLRPLFTYWRDSTGSRYYTRYTPQIFSGRSVQHQDSLAGETLRPDAFDEKHSVAGREPGTFLRQCSSMSSDEDEGLHDGAMYPGFMRAMNPTPALPPPSLGRNSPARGPLSQNPVLMQREIGRAL